MISSKITHFYTYVFYLIGKIDLKVERRELNNAIGRWYFMASLTSRYTGGSPETLMERDLADFRSFATSKDFIEWIDKTTDSELTEDFWQVTLPARLETSSATSPLLYCYHAALNLLDARALFSDIRIWDALDPTTQAKKEKVERHHLFPKNYLAGFGLKEPREVNQIANFALVEWRENIAIADDFPNEYFPKFIEKYDQQKINQYSYWHALPEGWENMAYGDFLRARRSLIAKVIKDGYGINRRGPLYRV